MKNRSRSFRLVLPALLFSIAAVPSAAQNRMTFKVGESAATQSAVKSENASKEHNVAQRETLTEGYK